MSLFIAVLLAGILIFYVLKPIFNSSEAAFAPDVRKNSKFDDLIKQKKELLQELKEIDFEYQMGKLSDQDYENLKNDYENQAINVLQKMDGNKSNGKSKKDDIELEIEIHRKKNHEHHNNSVNFCTNCGNKLQPGNKFCSSCGTKIIE